MELLNSCGKSYPAKLPGECPGMFMGTLVLYRHTLKVCGKFLSWPSWCFCAEEVYGCFTILNIIKLLETVYKVFIIQSSESKVT